MDQCREPRHWEHLRGLLRPSICELLYKSADYDAGAFDFGQWTGGNVPDGEA